VVALVRNVLATREAAAAQVPSRLGAKDERGNRSHAFVEAGNDLIRGGAPAGEAGAGGARAAQEGARTAAVKVAKRSSRWNVFALDRGCAPRNAQIRNQAEVVHQLEIGERLERQRHRVVSPGFGGGDEGVGIGRALSGNVRGVVGPVIAAQRL